MEQTLEQLVKLLQKQKEIYEELFSVSQHKQRELINGSLEVIDALTRREESLIFQAAKLEEERFRCTKDVMGQYGLEEDSSLTDLLGYIDGQEKEKLQAIYEGLGSLISDMDRVNQENMSLIKQSLRYINFTMEAAIGQDSAPVTSYGGKEGQGSGISHLVDKKI